MLPVNEVPRPFFVRMKGNEEDAKKAFGSISQVIRLEGLEGEFGFLTEMMPEKTFREKLEKAEGVINWYRRGKMEEEQEA